jgi:glycosyltransferase involved in cell wall biosynthesis
VISYLTDELVRQDHCVTLVASGDSTTSAELMPDCERTQPLDPHRPATGALHITLIEQVFKRATTFDISRCHTDSLHFALARRCTVPVLATVHGRMNLAGLDSVHREFSELPLVSISDPQHEPLPWASWAAAVHHGLPVCLHVPTYAPGCYLAFMGWISPEKGIDRVIAIAQRSNVPVRIAAQVDDAEYFARFVEPLLSQPHIQFLGEINESDKSSFLGGALALLFPIDWPGPFGLSDD